MSTIEDAGQLAALELLDSRRGGYVSFHSHVLEYSPHATVAEVQYLYDKYIGRPSSPATHDPDTGAPAAGCVRYEVPRAPVKRRFGRA